MVLYSELQRRAPGFHQQGAPGATTEVGLGGVAPSSTRQARILTDALAYLAKKGLTAAAVITNFHQHRVIPLVERALPIFQLTPGSQVEGSRTSYKLLSRTTAARRAKYAVAELKGPCLVLVIE